MLTQILVQGMHGLGDTLHERAIVRELLRDHEVWLKTSWPQLFHDMPELHLLPLQSPLGWMKKNEIRCAAMYEKRPPPSGARFIECGYLSRMPRPGASVLGIMAEVCGVAEVGDFRLPVAPEWRAKAEALLAQLAPTKPVLIYRPPIELGNARNRGSSRAKVARNPDLQASHALIAGIRDRYFVISLADLTGGQEALVGPQIEADAEFHHGELEVETIVALTALAELVFCSPGFLCVLAQAVSTPMICVFGGFEGKESFAAGARYSPWLPIEPLNPCACWSHNCRHDKTIDVAAAAARIEDFIDADSADTAHARQPAQAAGARAAA